LKKNEKGVARHLVSKVFEFLLLLALRANMKATTATSQPPGARLVAYLSNRRIYLSGLHSTGSAVCRVFLTSDGRHFVPPLYRLFFSSAKGKLFPVCPHTQNHTSVSNVAHSTVTQCRASIKFHHRPPPLWPHVRRLVT
jgi:hypothetical protein